MIMYGHGYGMASWYWMSMAPAMIVVAGLLVALLVYAARIGSRSPSDDRSTSSAEATLTERFARGEIDTEEYEQRLRTVRARRTLQSPGG